MCIFNETFTSRVHTYVDLIVNTSNMVALYTCILTCSFARAEKSALSRPLAKFALWNVFVDILYRFDSKFDCRN